MFRENNDHYQVNMLDTANWMNQKTIEKLNKSWAAIFYKEVFCKIDEKIFSEFYSSENGRPNVPVNILLGLEYIKKMFDYTDEELFENFDFNYLVSYAVGVKRIGQFTFAKSSFYEFRKKLYKFKISYPEAVDAIDKQFEILLQNFISKASIDTTIQRTDSTSIIPNIAKMGRLALAYDVLSNALRVIPKEELPESLKEATTSGFKKDMLYKVKSEDKDSKFEVLMKLCYELFTIIKDNKKDYENRHEIHVLERFLNEQTKIVKNKMIVKKSKEISSDSLQSAYDEDATFRNKAGKKESGYVLNISETCSKTNRVQFITDYTIETNNTSDKEILRDRIEEIKETGCTDIYADGAYYTKENGKEKDIKVHYTDMTGKAENPDKISVTKFLIDDENLIKECPNGVKPETSEVKINSNGDNVYVATFNKKECEKCPLKENCQIKINRKNSVVRIKEKSYEAARTRLDIKINQEENSSYRVAIEGTNSELKRKHGMKKLRVRGITKTSIVCGLIVAACNIKRFIKYITKSSDRMDEYCVITS